MRTNTEICIHLDCLGDMLERNDMINNHFKHMEMVFEAKNRIEAQEEKIRTLELKLKNLGVSMEDVCMESKSELLVENTNNSWTPIETAEPSEDGHYLVSFDDGFVATVDFVDKDWELWADSGEPVAWMNLPNPYQKSN